MASDTHTSLPRVFSSGDFKEWLTRFNICAASNGWDDTKKYAKIATFLEGEALAVYLEMDKTKDKFSDLVTELENNFHPPSEEFNVISAFNERRMLLNETPRLFLHELKKLLKSSGIPKSAHEKLLLHQFICGLPPSIRSHIKLLPDIKTPEDALKATQKLNAVCAPIEETKTAMAVADERKPSTELEEMKSAVQALTEKVDALLDERRERLPEVAALQRNRRPIICFRCQKPGHPARLCRAPFPTLPQQSGNDRGRGTARTQPLGRNSQGSRKF